MVRRRRRVLRPRFDRLDDRWLPSVAVPGLTPAQVNEAYGFNPNAFNGSGQTIAIVDAFHDPNLARELATFDRQFGLPAASLTQVGQYGGAAGGASDDGWAGEESLDAEWVHASAPGARIVVVEANSDSFDDLLAAVDTARHIPGVSVVAMSWGGGEFPGQTAYDSTFTTPAGHTPVTFLAATGDQGAFGGASYPATSPNVIAVGGTSLRVDTAGNYLYETGWSGGGGGYSWYEAEPGYQRSVQSTGVKSTPDVSILGDPNTGVATYSITPSTGQGSWYQVGGTSASTQIWAGVIAVADQIRVTVVRESTLGTTAALNDLYNSTGAFNDITSGYNGYNAAPGYDLVTGIGTPRGTPAAGSYTTLSLLWPGTSTSATQAAAAAAARVATTPTHKATAAMMAATGTDTTASATPAAVAVVAATPTTVQVLGGSPGPLAVAVATTAAPGVSAGLAAGPSGASAPTTAVPQPTNSAPAFARLYAPRSAPAPKATPEEPAARPADPGPRGAAPAEADAPAEAPALPAPESAPAPAPEAPIMPPAPAPTNQGGRRDDETEAAPPGAVSLTSLGGGLFLTVAAFRWADRPRVGRLRRGERGWSVEPLDARGRARN